MKRFYKAALAEGLSVPAALRAAQRSMIADDEWKAPAVWAGFVVQGDWI